MLASTEGFSKAGQPSLGPLGNNHLRQLTMKVGVKPTYNPLPFQPSRNRNGPAAKPITEGNLQPLRNHRMSRLRGCRWQYMRQVIVPTCLKEMQLAGAYPCWLLPVPRCPSMGAFALLSILNLRDESHELLGFRQVIAGHFQQRELLGPVICTNAIYKFRSLITINIHFLFAIEIPKWERHQLM